MQGEQIMSAISGNGYGSSHNWARGHTTQSNVEVNHGDNATYFECEDCGEYFRHYYHSTPDIFEAIRNAGVPDKCSAAKGVGK